MIVKCEQCQTRFKIPDDKVTDKGVKVRCTKCGHTFRVTRDMGQPAAAPAAAAPPPPLANDPFAKFGTPAAPPMGEVTRPGVFALGVEATRAPERAGPPPSFDFASLAPPAAPTVPAIPAYAPSAPTVPAVPAYVPAAPSNPFDFAAVAPPAPAAFDFSSYGAPTQPVAPLPAARPPPPPASIPPPAFDFSSVAPPAQAPAAYDFAAASQAPAYGAAPAAAPPAFDFAAVAPPGPAPAAFDFASVAPPPGDAAPPPAFDFAAVAPPTPAPASSAPFDFGAPAGGPGADNFFAATPAAPDLGGPSAGDARAMFDLPPAPAAAAAAALLDVPPAEPEAAPAPARVEKPAAAPAAPSRAPAAEAPEKGRRRNAVGIIVNVVIAALLVVGLVVVGSAYLNEGKFSADALTLENLKNTFAPSVDFVANDVSNGLYETRQGRAVFFVRGEVLNRSEASVKLVVKAEIVEGGKVVRFGESWAGDPATPEELFLIDGAEALEVLNGKVEKRALVVPPGAAAAFVVPFTEYPPDLKDFRVRVSARAVPAEPTAANP